MIAVVTAMTKTAYIAAAASLLLLTSGCPTEPNPGACANNNGMCGPGTWCMRVGNQSGCVPFMDGGPQDRPDAQGEPDGAPPDRQPDLAPDAPADLGRDQVDTSPPDACPIAECTVRTRRCGPGGGAQECVVIGGCVRWGAETACAPRMCTEGLCCASGEKNCEGTCRDTTADNRNCGACGKTCMSNEQCKGGMCLLVDAQPCTAGAQCLSGVCTSFFRDADGDTYGTNEMAGRCTITEPPAGYAGRAGDCCDLATDARVRSVAARIHPGAAWETQSAEGLCGVTWDYDCDGRITARTEAASGCKSAAPPCETTYAPADPKFCGVAFVDCGGCQATVAIPPDPPACAFSMTGGQGCVDNVGPTPCR